MNDSIIEPRRLDHRPLIDVIVPAYNEADCVDELVRRLTLVFDSESRYDFRAIIVENGSVDDTWRLLRAANARDPRFTVVRLARNFHMDGGLTAGLEYATGDAAVFMTADLQDEPEVIPRFLRQWEAGYDNVYGLVTKREGTTAMRRANSQLYYWLAHRATSGRVTRNASDFRLMDRRLYETLRRLDESNRFMRGLVAWSGFHSVAVEIERPPRFAGSSKAYSLPVVGLALRSIFAHSYFPLRMISLIGIVACIAAGLALLDLVWESLSSGVPFAGYGTIVALLLLMFGLLAMMLGVIAEYVALIYEEVKGRPNFIVRETAGIEERARSSVSI